MESDPIDVNVLEGTHPDAAGPLGDLLAPNQLTAPPLDDAAQSTAGQPITFISGQFEGQTIRVTLDELQAADVGRKYSRKDRRPLDPPPIVRMKLFRVFLERNEIREEEIQSEIVRPEGFVCHLDLFTHPPHSPGADALNLEPVQVTKQLAGSTFVQAYNLALTGAPTLFFPFTDVSIRQEGTFRLRYRAFNIMGTAHGNAEHPVLAECYGTPFRVYSTKEFPGLATSTEMTQHLALMGVRVNNRTVERKRRRVESEERSGDDE